MGTSLALRAVHRGPYIPGFDVLGASAGLMFVAAEPAEEFLREYTAYRTSEFPAWNVIVAPAILPGVLAHVFPWEYWPHAVTLALFVLTLGLLGRGLDLRGDEFPSLLLAWACSSTLVSHAIVGLPYLSNTLPFGVALWVVLRTRHWLATLVLCLLTTELAWHAQELGRTVFMVFLAAGLLLPGPTWSTRAIWLATGAGQVVLARSFPSFNTKSFTRMTLPSLAQGLDAAVALGQHFLLQRPDLFIVLPIAACVIWLCGRQRWFWLALVGGQFALIFLLAANSGTLQGVICVWPRRTVVLTFVAIGAIVAALRHMGDRRRWLRRALLLGALVQLGHTIAWASRPLDARDPAADFTLPYTETKVPGGMHLDMRVPFLSVRWYLEMREKVDGGATVLLLYNLSSYDENATDPAGIPDRLHLHLGLLDASRVGRSDGVGGGADQP